MPFWNKIFGDPNARVISAYEPVVAKINGLEPEMEKLSADELRSKTEEFKSRIKNGATLDDLLPEAFAVVREAAKRTLGQRHYDVQLMGGLALHAGAISEMRTGEGKTLTATLPLYLNALTDRGAHLVTVNDYLARRDAVWMGQIYYALGMTVGVIQQMMISFKYDPQKASAPEDKERDTKGAFKVEMEFLQSCSRKEAYACDITYGTNNEFGFDYLRDNMAPSLAEMSQRDLSYAIIDEVDSILIDEARTPLIISAPAEEATDQYYKFAEVVRQLTENEDYNVDEKLRAATLTDVGIAKIEKLLGMENIYVEGGVATVHHVESALKAHALFKRDKEYVVRDGEVLIVDEFTGRLMPGRRYSEGLHQAIEAKENVPIQRESQTLATVTFQNLFRLYEKLAGMTGTAVTEAEEFGKIYNLEVVVIPPNKNSSRADLQDRIYKTEEAKFRAVTQEVKARHEKGQPVLLGTISIERNELLSELLSREGIPHNILNAKNHEREAEFIAQAGRLGAVTLATNMAGRGVDIILGGNPSDAAEAEKVRLLGGLFVLGTERHESRRIDNQLRGRSGRQGDPGETQFFVSTEDDLLRIFAGDRMKAIMERLHLPDDQPIEHGLISKSIEASQKKVEGHNFDTRKHLLEYDDVLNKHREVIYKKRREILAPATPLRSKIIEMIENEVEQVTLFHTQGDAEGDWNIKEIAEVMRTIFPSTNDTHAFLTDFESLQKIVQSGAGDKLEDATSRTKIIERIMEHTNKEYDELERRVTASAGAMQALGVVGGDADADGGRKFLREIEKSVLLRAMDTLWIEHLEAINYLRASIGLRGYAQQDPLVEYKRETYRLFNELLTFIQKEVVYSIFKVSAGIEAAPSLLSRRQLMLHGAAKEMGTVLKGTDLNGVARDNAESAFGSGGVDLLKPVSEKVRDADGHKIGRNDPCWCGSGKKFKKCHGV